MRHEGACADYACQKRLRSNELARFYHWKQRNLLPPLDLLNDSSKNLGETSRIKQFVMFLNF